MGERIIRCFKCQRNVEEKNIKAPYIALFVKKHNEIDGYAYGCIFCKEE